MKKKRVRWGRVILAGLLATIVGFVVGYILYGAMNGVYAQYADLPYAKPMDSVAIYLITMLAGGSVLTVLLALVYAVIQTGLPGQKPLVKGLSFGVMLMVVFMLPTAFNTWMQIAQPDVLILIEAVNRSIGLMVQAVIIALVYERGASA